MEDNQSQSYSESRIQSLRREVEVSKTQMLQLAYNQQKLINKIDEFNLKGFQCINHQNFYDAIVYLSQAQKVLEYAAGCGKTIQRMLIITTLHNQACAYQRIWQLPKSADYIQAITYNITSFINNELALVFNSQNMNKHHPNNSKLTIYFTNKLQLISCHLQFCAVSSQIKNHVNALASAEKALYLLKSYCEELYTYEKVVGFACSTESEKNLLLDLQNIRNFQNQTITETQKNIEKLLYKAKKSIAVFQKKSVFAPTGLSRLQQKELQNFSLGQLMQVTAVVLKKMQEKISLSHELSYLKKIYKAIYISIAHFTMATQLRLIANEQHGIDSEFRKLSKQFKESEVHHLVALITVSLYVPCYTKYFDHILNSFKNHYQIDLTQASDLSISEEEIHKFDDDLIHLQIQSISQRDSDLNQAQKINYDDPHSKIESQVRNDITRQTEKSNMSSHYDKITNRTLQDMTSHGSYSSSEKSGMKKMVRTARESQAIVFKKKQKHKKKLAEHTSKDRKTMLIQKQLKSKSKVKQNDKTFRRSKSKKSVYESSEEKVVHCFQYDNGVKKAVKKKIKTSKDKGEYELTKKNYYKVPKDKKSPQHQIQHELKKINHFAQSTKDIIYNQIPKIVKKHKSPQLNTSRSQKKILKRLS